MKCIKLYIRNLYTFVVLAFVVGCCVSCETEYGLFSDMDVNVSKYEFPQYGGSLDVYRIGGRECNEIDVVPDYGSKYIYTYPAVPNDYGWYRLDYTDSTETVVRITVQPNNTGKVRRLPISSICNMCSERAKVKYTQAASSF